MIETPKVFIIGAGRSGTNMLRDTLCSLEGVGTWPCDEINYIWRYGNSKYPNDELRPEHITKQTQHYIKRSFRKISKKYNLDTLVEKTCANSLRVSFIDYIFPQSKYIFITRDGRDVTASAIRQWTAPLDIGYILAKARYVPLNDIPHYASRYLFNRLARLRSKESRVSYWGPKFTEFEAKTHGMTVAEIAALQWSECVTRSMDQLSELPNSNVFHISYEHIISNPHESLKQILKWLGQEFEPDILDAMAKRIRGGSVSKWKNDLSDEVIERISPLIQPALTRLGYK